MKQICILTLVVFCAASAYGQNPTDTLPTIHIQFGDDPLKGENRVLYYEYEGTVYRNRKEKKRFIYNQLVPLVEASGDPAAKESLRKYRNIKGGKAVLGYLWIGGATIGPAFLTSAMIKDFASAFSQKEDPTIQRDKDIGSVLLAAGWASAVAFSVIAPRSKRHLHRTINQYNQSQQKRVSWRVLPTGTSLRLVGQF